MKNSISILLSPFHLSYPCLAQSSTENYVRTVAMLRADSTFSMKSVQYFDGIGRPTLSVATTGGGGETSYALTTYDVLGREESMYLPVATDNSLAYKSPTAFTASSSSFYGNDGTAYTRNHYDVREALDNKTGRYDEVLVYDANGNVRHLERRGLKQNGVFGKIDNLNLSYSGNHLVSVEEDALELLYAGSFDYKGSRGSHYEYNGNGSLTCDRSRGIAFIAYDLSGNPRKTYFTNGNVTEYVYSASGQKLRVTHYTAVPNITRPLGVQPPELTAGQILHTDVTDYLLGGRVTMRDGRVDKVLFEGGYCQATQVSSSSDSFAFYYYNQDHLGNIREVVDASGTVQQVDNYYPFGTPYCDSPSAQSPDLQPYKYNGKELDRMHGLDTYDYGARQYDPVLCRWDRMDPLCEKYYGVSPYAYCGNNPIKYNDPDGMETHVVMNDDGTYRVIGGTLNDDRNIYVYSQDKKGNYTVRGKSIGVTSSITSFYNSDYNNGTGAWAKGAVINPKDKSGRTFLNKMMSENVTLDDYMDKARNYHTYDFKVTNGGDDVVSKSNKYIYRGMSIGVTAFGQTIYSSARDIGNIAAGAVAAKNGIPWFAARLAFDIYQGGREGISTQNAEYYGWSQTYIRSNGIPESIHLRNSMSSYLKKIWSGLKKLW